MNRRQAYARYLELVFVLFQKEMKVRYKSTFLGYLWSLLNPLCFAFAYFLVFKTVLGIPVKDYHLFLITGLFPWQCFANSAGAAPQLFLANASIIRKINFPRNALPMSAVLQDMAHFALALPVIAAALMLRGAPPSLSWLYGIPILMALQLLLTYGVVLAVSSVNVFFRDLERVNGIALALLFYFTPVVYPETMAPERFRELLYLNPLAPLMMGWRKLLLGGELDPACVGAAICSSLLSLAIGTAVYRKLSWKFAEAV